MAKKLTKTGITTGNTVRAFHVTQSVDAFTGTDAYDILLSGSLNTTGSIIISGSPTSLSASGTIFGDRIITSTGGYVRTPSIGGSSMLEVTSPTKFKIGSHITASGNISSSGDIMLTIDNNSAGTSVLTIDPTTGRVFRTGSYGGSGGGGSTFPFTGSAAISGTLSLDGPAGHITASGNISSSKYLYGQVAEIDDLVRFGRARSNNSSINDHLNFENSITVTGNNNITASGDISASGIINASRYDVNNQRVIAQDTFGSVDSININPSSSPILKFGASQGIVLTSDVTGSARTISGSSLIGEATNVYRPITTLSTNPFTASNATAGTYYRAGGNITCSIFVTASVSCTTGVEFEFIQTSSAGNVLFETGSGVTLNSKSGNLKITGQFSAVTLKYVGNNEWDLIGDLS